MSARIAAKDLRYALKRVRPYRAGVREVGDWDKLKGVGIRADEDWVTVWATDGYRLAECWGRNRGEPLPPTAIPRMYVDTLESLLRTESRDTLIDFETGGSGLYDMRWEHQAFSFSEGEVFPDPETTAAEVKVDQRLLLEKVTELKAEADDLARGVKKDNGTVRIAICGDRLYLAPGREGQDGFRLQSGNGEGEADIALDPRYLKQALDVPKSDVLIRIADPRRPAELFFPTGRTRAAIMPIDPRYCERLND